MSNWSKYSLVIQIHPINIFIGKSSILFNRLLCLYKNVINGVTSNEISEGRIMTDKHHRHWYCGTNTFKYKRTEH